MINVHKINNNIYITSDEEIKEGDWYLLPLFKGGCEIKKYNSEKHFAKEPCISLANLKAKKIILTTDQSLDGVQSIDDDFLDIIPQEQPKQETLEEAVKRMTEGHDDLDSQHSWIEGFEKGAKWQAKRMYSEEEMRKCWNTAFANALSIDEDDYTPIFYENFIKQFKKK